MVNQQSQPFLLENIGNYQRQMIYLSGSKIGEMQRMILKLYGADPRSDRPDLGIRTQEGQTNSTGYALLSTGKPRFSDRYYCFLLRIDSIADRLRYSKNIAISDKSDGL